MTYGEIYKQFLEETKMDRKIIEDYRPCVEMYGVPDMPEGIVVWLKNGWRIIYIPPEKKECDNQ